MIKYRFYIFPDLRHSYKETHIVLRKDVIRPEIFTQLGNVIQLFKPFGKEKK